MNSELSLKRRAPTRSSWVGELFPDRSVRGFSLVYLKGFSRGGTLTVAISRASPQPPMAPVLAALPLQPAVLAQELTEPLLKLTAARDVAVNQPQVRSTSQGEASWYGPGFFGNLTANGEIYRPGTMTAAHRTLPFGTRVRVTNLWNGRSAVVRINDRGPYVGQRVIDLGHGAAEELGLFHSGIAQVKLEVLQ